MDAADTRASPEKEEVIAEASRHSARITEPFLYRREYRSMENIAAEYGVSRDTIDGQYPLGGARTAERKSAAEQRDLCIQNQLKQAPIQDRKILYQSFFAFAVYCGRFWRRHATVHLEFWAEE